MINDVQLSYEGPGEQVWRFRFFETYNDPNAQGQPPTYQVQPIAAELRGKKFDGFINNGDIVKIVKGKWTKGGTLEVEELWNQTTNSQVKRKRF